MPFKLAIDGKPHSLTILARRPQLVVAVDGRRHVVETVDAAGDGRRALTIDGAETGFVRAETVEGALLRIDGRTIEVRRLDAATEASAAGSGAHLVRAPMPGIVISIHKTAGDSVRRGETVITIESMKLQMKLDAPRDGEIAEIGIREGEGFEKDAVLARLAAPASEG